MRITGIIAAALALMALAVTPCMAGLDIVHEKPKAADLVPDEQQEMVAEEVYILFMAASSSELDGMEPSEACIVRLSEDSYSATIEIDLPLNSTEDVCTEYVEAGCGEDGQSDCIEDSPLMLLSRALDEEASQDGAGDPELVLVSLNLNTYRMDPRAIKAVDQNLKVITKRIPKNFTRYLERSGRYLDMMKEILRDEGIPEDMAYLPLIESGFNNKAYSRAKAVGPWQFMKGTGVRYGLKVNTWVDERRDPVKSTRAAARYLKDLYSMFNSWSLAMAAYNAGEGRIMKAIKRTGSEDFWDIMVSRHIKRETKNYVPKFIAARLVAVDPASYGLGEIDYHEPISFDEVQLDYPLSLDVAARCAESSVEEIKELNPELRLWSTPPVKGYMLKVPEGKAGAFEANMPKIPKDKRVTVEAYKVRPGDTVSTIAKRKGVTKDSLIAYNKLSRSGFIRVGQTLLIPMQYRVN